MVFSSKLIFHLFSKVLFSWFTKAELICSQHTCSSSSYFHKLFVCLLLTSGLFVCSQTNGLFLCKLCLMFTSWLFVCSKTVIHFLTSFDVHKLVVSAGVTSSNDFFTWNVINFSIFFKYFVTTLGSNFYQMLKTFRWPEWAGMAKYF